MQRETLEMYFIKYHLNNRFLLIINLVPKSELILQSRSDNKRHNTIKIAGTLSLATRGIFLTTPRVHSCRLSLIAHHYSNRVPKITVVTAHKYHKQNCTREERLSLSLSLPSYDNENYLLYPNKY